MCSAGMDRWCAREGRCHNSPKRHPPADCEWRSCLFCVVFVVSVSFLQAREMERLINESDGDVLMDMERLGFEDELLLLGPWRLFVEHDFVFFK